MIAIHLANNMDVHTPITFDLIYADYIYENLNFDWVDKFWNYLNPNSIFIAQTDDSSMAQMKLKLDSMPNAIFVNTCIQVQEWGGVPKKGFPKKHDYIFIYANGKDFKWYGDRIQVAKVTAGTKFDKKGTGLKTPCDVFYDLPNFSTMAKERIKTVEGHNIRWQKSQSVLNRLALPMTDENDCVLDIFMGSASLGEWCLRNNRNYFGIENDPEVFSLAKSRLDNVKKELEK